MKSTDQSNAIISSYDVCHFANAEQTLLLYDADTVPARLHVGPVAPVGEPVASDHVVVVADSKEN